MTEVDGESGRLEGRPYERQGKEEPSGVTRVLVTHDWGARQFGFHLGQEWSRKNCNLTWMEEE
jgi:hypothetical protein